MVKASPSPVSSLMVQLLYLLHMPLIGAKPAEIKDKRCWFYQGHESQNKIKPPLWSKITSPLCDCIVLSTFSYDRFGRQQRSVTCAWCICICVQGGKFHTSCQVQPHKLLLLNEILFSGFSSCSASTVADCEPFTHFQYTLYPVQGHRGCWSFSQLLLLGESCRTSWAGVDLPTLWKR